VPFSASLGKTQSRSKSPWVASVVQTVICVVWIVFLTFVIVQPQSNGSMNYELGIAHGSFVPAGGIGTYGWLATIGTMTLIVVYCLTAIAAPLYARRRQREFSDNEFNWFTHVVAPIVGILVMLLPLLSLFLPFFGLQGVLTNIGFAPSPFPVNVLPAFFFIWLIVGILLLFFFIRRSAERYNRIGHFVRTND